MTGPFFLRALVVAWEHDAGAGPVSCCFNIELCIELCVETHDAISVLNGQLILFSIFFADIAPVAMNVTVEHVHDQMLMLL